MDLVYRRIDKALAKLSQIVAGNRRVVLTTDGEPTAILLSIDDYRSMQATIALANDPAMLQHVLNDAQQMSAATAEELAPASVSEDSALASVSQD